MLKSLTRVASVTALTSAMLAGGLLLAPAANAAEKVSTPSFYVAQTVGSPSHLHLDTFSAKHEGSKTTTFDGERVYKAYTVKITRGKHVLFERKHVSLARASYIAERAFAHLQASDKAVVAGAKKAMVPSYKYVAAHERAVAKAARVAAIRADVRQTVLNVQTALANGTPISSTDSVQIINSHIRGKETVSLVAVDDEQNYTITAVDGYDHVTYSFDSRNGQFTTTK